MRKGTPTTTTVAIKTTGTRVGVGEKVMEGTKKQRKPRARWSSDAEKKLIELWAEIMKQTGGKMMTRKKKEILATRQLNDYVKDNLENHVL